MSLIAGSLSNVTVILAAASTGSPTAVGAVGVLMAFYVVALCVARGLLGEWLLLTESGRPAIAAEAAGAALVAGLAAGAISLPITLLLVPQQSAAGVLLAVSLPVLLLQDTLRYVAISRNRSRAAAISDVLWLTCAVFAIVVCLATGRDQTTWLIGAWASGSVLGAAYLLAVCQLCPRLRSFVGFIRSEPTLRLSLAADATLTTGTLSISILLCTGIIGVAGAGVIRFLQTVFGPVTLLFGIMYVEFASRRGPGSHQAAPWRAAIRMALLLTLSTIGVAVLLAAVPRLTGHGADIEVLGGSVTVLLVFTASQIAAGLGTSAATGLKLDGRAATAARIRSVWAVSLIAGTVLGGALAGVIGYIWASTIVHLVATAVWWHHLAANGRTRRTA